MDFDQVIVTGVVILMMGIALTFIYFSIVFHYPVITLFDHAGTHSFPLYPLIDRIFESDSFILSKEEKWRKQETLLQLYLPVGTVFHIDKNMSPILGYHKNYTRHDMAGALFIMTDEGLRKE